MRDRTVGDTFYMFFTTRAFASGIPTVLAGTPVVSAYEDNSVTQITAGITLGVDHDSVVGLNLLTIAATGGNGYETGKDYTLVITTGTVSGVSVVGEVVGEFSLSLSAAAIDLSNGTDGLGAIKADTAAILVDTGTTIPALLGTPATDISADIAAVKVDTAATLVDTAQIGTAGAGLTDLGGMSTAMKAEVNTEVDTGLTDYDGPTNAEMEARTLVAASYFDPAADTVATVTTVTTVTGGATSAAQTTAQNDLDIITGASGVNLLTATQASIDAIEADTNELQTDWANGGRLDLLLDAIPTTAMRGTDSAALASVCTETRLAELDAANLPADLDAVLVDTGTTIPALIGTPATDISADIAAVKVDTAATLVDTAILTSVFAVGAAITGTLSITQMSTNLTEATDDHYNGRLITWTSGVLLGQQTDITDYTGATKVLTYTATTDAPSNTDTFVIT